jgi:hypothetical protein
MKRFSNIAQSLTTARVLASANQPVASVVSVMQYLGQWHLPAIGGLSGINYDSKRDSYYLLTHNRSGIASVRLKVRLALSSNGINRAEILGTHKTLDEKALTGFDGLPGAAALSDTSFLGVEHAAGVSIYRGDIDPASDVVTKTPLIDLSAIPALRPLDNIAGITLGPSLPDGRASVVLVSKSHCSPPEATRLVAFALYHRSPCSEVSTAPSTS